MAHTDYIKIMLNIKDDNIYFYENCLEIVNINGKDTKVFNAFLTYAPEYCPKCGCINKEHNAILIPDRFHIDLQVRDALDNTRKKLCIKSNPNYRKLKKYWKLILKNEDKLSDKKKYSKCFKKEVSHIDIVTYLINTDEEFYNTYQGIIKAIDTRDKDKFLNIIHHHNKTFLNI